MPSPSRSCPARPGDLVPAPARSPPDRDHARTYEEQAGQHKDPADPEPESSAELCPCVPCRLRQGGRRGAPLLSRGLEVEHRRPSAALNKSGR
ncbi:hypothetical protein GW7_20741 [Heterocephalus glaber]|uniref:Uncharacterized protein n=1 Tax=Heterocephalus glaber TaxID=10181 RepID=G5B9R5_HETGA|nr:hypothetical protein GW7_20741 [Heterocephalus glaber]